MITNPMVEGFCEQLGVSTAPSFSWGFSAGDTAMYQEAYRLVVHRGEDVVFDSGRINSNKTQGISIGDTALQPCTKYEWDLYVWNENGTCSESLGMSFVTGVKNWEAEWIGTGKALPYYARKTFNVDRDLVGAYAYVCGLGQFKLFINGEKVGDHELDPGWTDYNDSVQYVTFDIKNLLNDGANAVEISVGNGWYSPQKVNHFYFNNTAFSDHLTLICRIVLEYADGKRQVVSSGGDWRVRDSATTVANVYGSEYYDARLYPEGWAGADFDDSEWNRAVLTGAPEGRLVPQNQPPLKIKKVYDTISVKNVNATTNIFDVGQNMSGMFEIYVSGPAGAEIKIIPVEKLDSDGSISQSTDTFMKYTLAGTGEIEVWKPDFSYVGARWVQIEGAVYTDAPIEGKAVIHDVKGHFVTNSARTVGNFITSDERYLKVYDLILRAIESNLQSVHTDCPTVEKLGWLETSQLMGPGIFYNKDSRELFRKIARDAAEAQENSGLIPDVTPAYPHFSFPYWDSPAWGSAGVIVPWLLYQYYGDTYSLKENYDAMKKYVAYLKSKEDSNGMIMQGLGDWGIEPSVGIGQANLETGIYYWDICILRDTAALFGYDEDAEYFSSEARRVMDNYNKLLLVKNEDTDLYAYRDVSRPNIYDQSGCYSYNGVVQANQAIALYLDGLIHEEHKSDIVNSFRISLKSGQIRSGEIGHRFILQMAGKYGLSDAIHKKVTGCTLGSYYRFVLNGETSLPEYWVDDARSRNHDMLGHVMEWFYNGVGGISYLAPGFTEILVAPRPPKALEDANVEYESVKGKIVSSWEHHGGKFSLHAQFPANTRGTISVPTFFMTDVTVTSGDTVLFSGGNGQSSGDITFVCAEEDSITFEVSNGTFDFVLTGNEMI